MSKLSAEFEALRDNLRSVAEENGKQQKSIDVLKQQLANFEFNAAKKTEATEKFEK